MCYSMSAVPEDLQLTVFCPRLALALPLLPVNAVLCGYVTYRWIGPSLIGSRWQDRFDAPLHTIVVLPDPVLNRYLVPTILGWLHGKVSVEPLQSVLPNCVVA